MVRVSVAVRPFFPSVIGPGLLLTVEHSGVSRKESHVNMMNFYTAGGIGLVNIVSQSRVVQLTLIF